MSQTWDARSSAGQFRNPISTLLLCSLITVELCTCLLHRARRTPLPRAALGVGTATLPAVVDCFNAHAYLLHVSGIAVTDSCSLGASALQLCPGAADGLSETGQRGQSASSPHAQPGTSSTDGAGAAQPTQPDCGQLLCSEPSCEHGACWVLTRSCGGDAVPVGIDGACRCCSMPR